MPDGPSPPPPGRASPLVSIVVNNFNFASLVGVAIRSALEQSYQATEVIVVDDGSTDGSREVIASFGFQVEAVFKENGGQGSAFNAGFERARGDIVIFLDADDLLLPNAVERIVPRFDADDVVKVHWYLLEVDEVGASLGRRHNSNLIAGDYRDRVIRDGPVSLAQSPTSGNAWARWFLSRVMPLPEHADKHGADGFLRKLCPIFGRIARVDEVLGWYRIHGGGYGGGASEIFNLRRGIARSPTYCRLLARHLGRQGVAVDPESWMGPGSHYEWLQRAVRLHQEIPDLVADGETVVLVDGGGLGCDFNSKRPMLPFPERDGLYWGAPVDGAQAREELERMRSAGATCVLVAFTAFWWLETYPELERYLRGEWKCRSASDRAVVFELPPPAPPCPG
jgi:Glycosyl transferase family 2